MKSIHVLMSIILVACALDAKIMQGGNYYVSTIVTQKDTVQQNEDDFIKGERDSLLTPLYSLPQNTVHPGHLILRTKKNSDVYRYYTGRLDTSGFNNSQPVFVFYYPHWARCGDMLLFRFYREPTEAIGTDMPTICFDSERLYVRGTSQLYYYKNGLWFSLTGTTKRPFGAIAITSNPTGAKVILNGVAGSQITPCTIPRLIGGEYTVEVQLPDYQFFRKTVAVVQDSITTASFELIADVDTVFITGEAGYTLLLLPQTPIDKPYLIDDSIMLFTPRIRIPPGRHRIRWDGDERYERLDTVLVCGAGKVMYFDYLFKLKYGIVRIIPSPFDVELCIDRFGCSVGERIEELPVGNYRVDASRHGFSGIHKDIHVYPDTITTVYFDLYQVPDQDGDGYIDSCDRCPDRYGLYKGCPTLHLVPVVTSMVGDVREFIRNDRFTVGFSMLGLVSKSAINKNFRNFLTVFSSGKTGGVNNYKGLTAFNGATVSWRGLFGQVELGQWSAGLRYQRTDSLFLDSTHLFFYDSSAGIEPVLYIPSTSYSVGFHYNYSWLNVAYSLGFQWEDIVIHHIYNRKTDFLESATFTNDWWYHQLCVEVDFHNGDIYIPSLYFRMKYPFGAYRQTRWTVFNAGFQLKITTRKKSS